MPDSRGDPVEAFVPGHITGFFSAHPADDPDRAGSRGAGITLSHGVTVRVEPARTSQIRLDDSPITVPPVARVLEALDVTARVSVTTEVPLGAGFGASGAMALGTALAANERFGCRRSENALISIAHRAEVLSGTGLGDVVAQARGGVPIRLEPGAPSSNEMDGIPAAGTIEYLAFGKLDTATVLEGNLAEITRAGSRALRRVVDEPTLETFMAASRAFAGESDLLSDRLAGVISAVEDHGGMASMAMLGKTVFAPGSGLSDAGFEPVRCSIHDAGATLVARSD